MSNGIDTAQKDGAMLAVMVRFVSTKDLNVSNETHKNKSEDNF